MYSMFMNAGFVERKGMSQQQSRDSNAELSLMCLAIAGIADQCASQCLSSKRFFDGNAYDKNQACISRDSGESIPTVMTLFHQDMLGYLMKHHPDLMGQLDKAREAVFAQISKFELVTKISHKSYTDVVEEMMNVWENGSDKKPLTDFVSVILKTKRPTLHVDVPTDQSAAIYQALMHVVHILLEIIITSLRVTVTRPLQAVINLLCIAVRFLGDLFGCIYYVPYVQESVSLLTSVLPTNYKTSVDQFLNANKEEGIMKNMKDIGEDFNQVQDELSCLAAGEFADVLLCSINCLTHLVGTMREGSKAVDSYRSSPGTGYERA